MNKNIGVDFYKSLCLVLLLILVFSFLSIIDKESKIDDYQVSIEELQDRIYLLTNEESLTDDEVAKYISFGRYIQDEYGIYSKEELDEVFNSEINFEDTSDDTIIFTDGPAN